MRSVFPMKGSLRDVHKSYWETQADIGCFLAVAWSGDDTEHACLTAMAYLEARGDRVKFTAILGRNLRSWLLCLPAGIGMATLRSIVKLRLGISPEKSGVYSAGNGAVMRAVV